MEFSKDNSGQSLQFVDFEGHGGEIKNEDSDGDGDDDVDQT